MKRRYKIDYNQKVDCFAQLNHIKTDLIYGDLSFVTKPFISYVIPVYRRADLLEKTLESVLQQKKVDFEWDIVVVDNESGGENDTEKLIRKLKNARILYYRNQENIGVDGNYNRCIETARGKWIAMLHGDDLIMNDHLYEMGKLIRSKDVRKKRYPLAYICQRYLEFSDEEEVQLDRALAAQTNKKLGVIFLKDGKRKKLMRESQRKGILTGFFGAVPSFGTIMNRKIMIQEGGFNKDLGICEDIITPYKLAGKYGVYMAPKIMGYYRFQNNESMKKATVLKIYAAMVDFREYMYSKNIWAGIWGKIARDLLNKNLQNYCVGLSRYSDEKVKERELNAIYQPKKTRGLKLLAFRAVMGCFNIVHHSGGYCEMIENLVEIQEENIRNAVDKGEKIVIYGAGGVSKVVIPLLKSRYKKIQIISCVVSNPKDAHGNIKGIPICCIDDIESKKDRITVITATEIWQYQSEMNAVLKSKGLKSVINLL
ncbi:glycosyltransferase [Lachnospiraceae bacterium WCA-9-b2]|uniref:Glycosyltransferase n=2 Tax=Sporofaciens musculi TaxID=2681861 RepID=A0A7X3MG82_9FIRM|nr:glycosyltransferase [Sporofaciens musculi]MXP75848.1 glycosyltransferase [Sporofaciens musculi]